MSNVSILIVAKAGESAMAQVTGSEHELTQVLTAAAMSNKMFAQVVKSASFLLATQDKRKLEHELSRNQSTQKARKKGTSKRKNQRVVGRATRSYTRKKQAA